MHRPTGRCWLREFLPDDLDQRARIMTYSHDSRWESYTVQKSFDGFAKDLLEALMRVRRSPEVWHSRCTSHWLRPSSDFTSQEQDSAIIFIGHSFGGLLIKQVRRTRIKGA
jgi:hypothetical protein